MSVSWKAGKEGFRRRVLTCLVLLVAVASCQAAEEGSDASQTTRRSPRRLSQRTLRDMTSILQAVRKRMAAGEREQAQGFSKQLKRRYLDKPDRLWHPTQFEILNQVFATVGDKQGQTAMASLWQERFKSDEEHRKYMTVPSVLRLARLLKDTKQDAAAKDLAEQIHEMLKKESFGKDMTFVELAQLVELSELTGVKPLGDLCRQQMASMTGEGVSFPKDLAPFEITRLFASYRDSDKSRARQLADFVAEDYLTQPGLSHALRSSEWLGLTRVAAKAGSRSSRQEMLKIVKAGIEDGSLKVESFRRNSLISLVTQTGEFGGDEALRSDLVARWLGLRDEWQDLDHASRRLITKAVLDEVSGSGQALMSLEARLTGRHDSGNLSLSDYQAACRTNARLGRQEAASTWAKRVFKTCLKAKAPGEVATEEIVAVSELLTLTKTTLTETESRQVLSALRAMEEGTTVVADEVYENLAGSFATENGKKLLDSSLVDASSRVNLANVKLLAWVSRREDRSRKFAGRMRVMAESAKTAGDLQARWWLARAYAVGLIREAAPIRSWGLTNIMRAFAVAETNPMRLRCIRELVAVCRDEHKYQHPIQAITSIKHQFTGTERTELEDALSALKAEAAKWVAADERSKTLREQGREWRQAFSQKHKGGSRVH